MGVKQLELSRVMAEIQGETEIYFPPTLGQGYETMAIPLCKACAKPSALATSLLAGPASLL